MPVNVQPIAAYFKLRPVFSLINLYDISWVEVYH